MKIIFAMVASFYLLSHADNQLVKNQSQNKKQIETSQECKGYFESLDFEQEQLAELIYLIGLTVDDSDEDNKFDIESNHITALQYKNEILRRKAKDCKHALELAEETVLDRRIAESILAQRRNLPNRPKGELFKILKDLRFYKDMEVVYHPQGLTMQELDELNKK